MTIYQKILAVDPLIWYGTAAIVGFAIGLLS